MKQKYPFIKVKLKHRISTKITHEQMAFILMLLWLRYAEINRQLQEHHHNTHLIYQHQRIFRFGFLQTLNYLSWHCSNICPSGYTHMQFLQWVICIVFLKMKVELLPFGHRGEDQDTLWMFPLIRKRSTITEGLKLVQRRTERQPESGIQPNLIQGRFHFSFIKSSSQ